jgi:hypothetical protein
MLLPEYRGLGPSEQLHRELLDARPEKRVTVTLPVDPSHESVLTLYQARGHERVGDQQPFPDSPRHAVMVRPLTHR